MEYNTHDWVSPKPRQLMLSERARQAFEALGALAIGKIKCVFGKHSWVDVVEIKTLRISHKCRRCPKRQYKAGQRWHNKKPYVSKIP
jgi:hypothetical protein